MEEAIRKATETALTELGAQGVSFAVEWPADLSHGDYAVNAAMAGAKQLGKNPRELADALAPIIARELGDSASGVEVAGPGFINIRLSTQSVSKTLEATTGSEWGEGRANLEKRVMVEYGNPNPFKEMHIGHMMGAIVGEATARIIGASGAHILRDTFGGDVGPHVAKALWALKRKGVEDITSASEIGDAYTEGSSEYEESEVSKQEIDNLNTKIYEVVGMQGTPELLSEDDRALLALWRKGREVSMAENIRIFSILGTHHDYIFYDSDTTEGGTRLVMDGLAKGIFERSEGAIIYRGEKKDLHTLVFITSRGAPLYPTKDIGLALLKAERVETDENIIVTAVEQIGHFKVTFAALEELAPALAQKTRHIAHGLLQLTTGKMSSRKGNVITADELILEMIVKAGERNNDPVIAQQVAVGALKYMVLRQAPGGDIIFDPEKSLSLDGDSGPYLQYALVRARSILAASTVSAAAPNFESEPPVLARLIARFPEVVARAESLRAPHAVTQYLTQLASEWNSYYAGGKIIGSEDEADKIALVRAFVATMENGLGLLGIPAPEKM